MLEPRASHASNVDGFLNVLLASHEAGVKRFVYASSSSVYGDEASEPKVEGRIGRPLSPYAATKLINEVYAGTFRRTHGIETVGLRYFNVFGPRQDPQGAYAAVIPRWAEQLISGEPCVVFGDGSASRDFCYVENVVQANLLAALAPSERVVDGVFNVACGARTSLLDLFEIMRGLVAETRPEAANAKPALSAPRAGDIQHSLASIERASELLGYRPTHDVACGLAQTIHWYIEQAAMRSSAPAAGKLREAS
jgi:UDP-N-acetylglucosamine 4-epimerase